MTVPAIWLSDDRCPACGGLLIERIQGNGVVTQDCGCGWLITWQADPDGGER